MRNDRMKTVLAPPKFYFKPRIKIDEIMMKSMIDVKMVGN